MINKRFQIRDQPKRLWMGEEAGESAPEKPGDPVKPRTHVVSL